MHDILHLFEWIVGVGTKGCNIWDGLEIWVSIRKDAIGMENICMYILIQIDRKKNNTKNMNVKMIA